MKKTYKLFIALSIILIIIAIVVYCGYNFATNYVFDKMYNQVITEMIDKEKNDNPPVENVETLDVNKPVEKKSQNSGKTSEIQDDSSQLQTPEKTGSEEYALLKISELTPEQLAEIQALITNEDKATAINMVKAALTKDDKREIKEMLKKGKIDYTRVKQILSKRLNTAEKKQIYGYYEKYSRIYFESKKSSNQ